MSTCGEWGTLATINVKSYAAYELIAQRIKGLGGEPVADLHTLPQPQTPADRDAHAAQHCRAGQAGGGGRHSNRQAARGHAPLSSARPNGVAHRRDARILSAGRGPASFPPRR